MQTVRRSGTNHNHDRFLATTILGNSNNDENDDNSTNIMTTRESDQLVLGTAGTVASCDMLYSEFVLSQTGCGLPAGPLGLVGALEGISYLSVVGLGGYSIFQKVTTVSGLGDSFWNGALYFRRAMSMMALAGKKNLGSFCNASLIIFVPIYF